jgi:transcription elongation factor GreA
MSGSTMGEIAAQYITSLDPDERPTSGPELNRFCWWFSTDRPFSELSALDIEDYQRKVESEGAPLDRRLSPVKSFLAFCYGEKLLNTNLAKFVRIPRKSKKTVDSRSDSRPATPEAILLSAEGLQKLRDELDYLIKSERPLVARELYDARLDKDIRENAGFDAAKQHQGLVEARIRELEAILGRAVVSEDRTDKERARLGSKVSVRDMDRGAENSYILVDSREANARQRKISIDSPVGRALLDHEVGDEIDITTPGGILRYRVEGIEA